MLDIIKISLMIVAIHACCQNGMIFSQLRIAVQNYFDRHLPAGWSDTAQKPLFGCLTCMASVWGFAGCLLLGVPPADWVETILCVCGINAIVSRFLADRD